MPTKAVVKKVVEEVSNLPGVESFRVLDLSCGDGAILEKLAALGCRVEGTHYREDDYIIRKPSGILQEAVVHEGIDLTQTLPFDDVSYDLVLATEVLEHLPAHAPLIAEAARVLKPGGYFIFTTPNVHRLSSRLQFFWSGMHNLKGARLSWHVPAEGLYSKHHNPVYFPVAHTVLHQQGMRVQRLGTIERRLLSIVMLLLYPVFAIAAGIETAHFKKRSKEGASDLFRWMVKPALLISEQLMVIAKKDVL